MDSGLSQIGRLFENIIALIGSVFGFLPPWVLVFMGSAFVFMVGVFIYKLIRG